MAHYIGLSVTRHLQSTFKHPDLSMPGTKMTWNENQYELQQKVLAIAQQYRILDSSGNLVGYVKQKAFKLKEDIRVFADDSMQQEVLLIKQQQVLDFSGAFAVSDPATGNLVGYLKRKGLKSILRDKWEILDTKGQIFGEISEADSALATLRRFIPFLAFIPKTYEVMVNGQLVATFKQKVKIIGDIWHLDFSADANRVLDRRLGICGALMMSMVERKKGA